MLDITGDVQRLCSLIGAGQIPKEIGNMKSLQELYFGENQLEGKICGHHQKCLHLTHSDWYMPNPKENR